MEIILGIALILSIAGNVITPLLLSSQHTKEKKELHIRLASKSQQEAEFWLRRPEEIKKEEKIEIKREKELKKLTPEEKEKIDKSKGF